MRAISTEARLPRPLKAEFEIDWPLKPADKEKAKNWEPMSWTPVQTDDMFAAYTGFIDGFPQHAMRKRQAKPG